MTDQPLEDREDTPERAGDEVQQDQTRKGYGEDERERDDDLAAEASS